MMAATHKHVEAFKLMWYTCKCGHKERVWNSRDGAVPFAIQCPSCGKASLSHDFWHLDFYAPEHQPHNGQLVFRDGTMYEAWRLIRRDETITDKDKQDEFNDLKTTGSSEYFSKGWPMYHRHPNRTNNAHVLEDILLDLQTEIEDGEAILNDGETALTLFGELLVKNYLEPNQ